LDGTFGATARSSQARIKSAQFGASPRLPPGRCSIEASAICFAIETGKLNGVSEFGFGFNSKTAISMCLRGFARMAGIRLRLPIERCHSGRTACGVGKCRRSMLALQPEV